MRNRIIIGKPYVTYADNKARLCSDIVLVNNETKTLYYEVDKEFAKYFNDSNSDCFLVGLLNSAMFENSDIECEGELSEQLLFQLQTYYIPLVSDLMSDMNAINVTARTTLNCVPNEGGVGTGNSGGVDSTYTMLKYSKDNMRSFKLTHVLFTNISTNDINDERIRSLFERDIPLKRQASEELGLKFIALYTNLYQFYSHPGIFNHYFAQQYCSAPLALGRLFKTYYFSSTFKVNDFMMDEKKIVSSGRYDLFSLKTLSTPSLSFYSAGTEVDRMDKIDYFIDDEYAKKFLQVCSIEQSEGNTSDNVKLNCGYCNKCGRMISVLYSSDKLDGYDGIFDLSHFYKNKAKFIGRNLEADQGAFAKKVEKLLKKNHKYPACTWFYRIIYRIRYKLAKNQSLVRIYHRLKGENT